MFRSPFFKVAALAIVLSYASGCKPKIGDDCTTSTDCSSVGDRLCDTTEPGGYCTIFACDPDHCPEEAACVAFDLSTDSQCVDPAQGARLARTFCLRACEEQDDCRGGYQCAIPADLEKNWAAHIIDTGFSSTGVCVVPTSPPTPPAGQEPNQLTCDPPDSNASIPYYQGSAGSGGSSGAGGSGATSGTSGTGGSGAMSGAGGATGGSAGTGASGGSGGAGGSAGTAGMGGSGATAGTTP